MPHALANLLYLVAAVLFVIGLRRLSNPATAVKGNRLSSVGMLIAIVVTLLARWLTVGLPVGLWPRAFRLPKGSGRVLTWGGLRGGISVALCLSLPAGPNRETLLAMTYCVVVFSILCQGLSIGRVVKRALR